MVLSTSAGATAAIRTPAAAGFVIADVTETPEGNTPTVTLIVGLFAVDVLLTPLGAAVAIRTAATVGLVLDDVDDTPAGDALA